MSIDRHHTAHYPMPVPIVDNGGLTNSRSVGVNSLYSYLLLLLVAPIRFCRGALLETTDDYDCNNTIVIIITNNSPASLFLSLYSPWS